MLCPSCGSEMTIKMEQFIMVSKSMSVSSVPDNL